MHAGSSARRAAVRRRGRGRGAGVCTPTAAAGRASLSRRDRVHVRDARRSARSRAPRDGGRCTCASAWATTCTRRTACCSCCRADPGSRGCRFSTATSRRTLRRGDEYRIVVFDQRGTGAGALDCQAMQRADGELGPHAAERARRPCLRPQARCAASVLRHRRRRRRHGGSAPGARRRQVVARRHLVRHVRRRALRARASVPRLEARARLGRAAGRGETDLGVVEFAAAKRVLHSVCGTGCVSDLAAVVRRDHLGPQLLDALTFDSIADPTYRKYWNVPAALHAASRGNRTAARSSSSPPRCEYQRWPAAAARPGPPRERALRRLAVSVGQRRLRRSPAARRSCGPPSRGSRPRSSIRSTADGLGQRVRPAMPAVDTDRADAARRTGSSASRRCSSTETTTSRRRSRGRGSSSP